MMIPASFFTSSPAPSLQKENTNNKKKQSSLPACLPAGGRNKETKKAS
jgi:hypothetical protein